MEEFSYNGKLIIFKAKPHHSEMKFDDPELSEEDQLWVDADLGEWDA